VTDLLLAADIQGPEIDYAGLSPLFALAGGTVIVLMAALFRGQFVQRILVPALTLTSLGAAVGLTIWQWETGDLEPIVENALAVDTLALGGGLIFYAAAILTVVLSLRDEAVRVAGAGEYFALLLSSVTGMVVFASAENLITLFVGIELLSIPLYALCAAEVRREASLESGLKYLIIGSLGSATLARPTSARSPPRSTRRSASTIPCSWSGLRWRSPASPSRDRSRRSTSGRPTCTRARRRRSRHSWRRPRRRRRSS
jgi:NADH-quinone oxidoreductase subunit N